jgi:hypothetical protein
MQILVEAPFSIDLFIALKNEIPPEGIVMHLPPMKGQRDMTAFIVWDPITIEVAKSLGEPIALGLLVNWLYDLFKNAPRPPKVTIRRRVVKWDKGALKQAIEEELTIDPRRR